MPGLIIWKNQQVNKLRKDVDRMFDRLWGEFGLAAFPRTVRDFPTIDFSETEDNLVVKAKVLHIDPEDIEIDITESMIRIKGEKKQSVVKGKEGFRTTESSYRTFSRTLQLPCRVVVEEVRANYKNGILNILLPKYKPKKTRAVQIER
jgi:HSP20 family protein